MIARDVMTRDVVSVTSDTPVRTIASLLVKNRISAVPVVDRSGVPIGTVSEGEPVGWSEVQVSDLVASERAISFGPFRLVPTQRLLLEDDNPVRLGSRALDILTALVERPGELVGKDELMARVWRGTFVEEGNLKFQVGALRRALGDGRGGRRYIATSAGQGYRFVAPVSVAQAPAAAPLPAAPTRQNHNLPQQLTRLIGRADAVSRIVARLQRHRLLSIVGPGGIGKTSVALAVAEASVNTYEHGVWFVDLAPLADARLVPSAVAQVLGFDIHSDDPVPGLVAALRDRRLVLVLDNCEHVIEAAATLAWLSSGVRQTSTSWQPAASRCGLKANMCSGCRRCRAGPHRTILALPKRLRFTRWSCLSSVRRSVWGNLN